MFGLERWGNICVTIRSRSISSTPLRVSDSFNAGKVGQEGSPPRRQDAKRRGSFKTQRAQRAQSPTRRLMIAAAITPHSRGSLREFSRSARVTRHAKQSFAPMSISKCNLATSGHGWLKSASNRIQPNPTESNLIQANPTKSNKQRTRSRNCKFLPNEPILFPLIPRLQEGT